MFRFVFTTTLLSPIFILCMTKPKATPPPLPHPLMMALETNEEIAELLIGFGCKVKITDEKRNSPMHVALSLGNVKYVELLLNAGALMDELNDLDHTPLITGLITKPENPAVKMLAEAGADVCYVCPNGLSALHWAIFNGDEDFVQYLIEKKIDVNAGHEKGYPPLAVALMTRADYLYVDRNGEETKMGRKSRVKFREENCNALILELEKEEEKIEYFLSVRVDNFHLQSELRADHSDRYTMETGKFGIIPLLLNESANPNLVYKRGDFEISPLCLAVYYKNNEAARRILERGARMDVTTFNGYSPFLIAVRNSYRDPGTIYMSDDVKIRKKKKVKTTFDENNGILSMLLKKNAQVNETNDLNETAVLWAVSMTDKDLLSYLKKHGAEIDLPETSKENQGKILNE